MKRWASADRKSSKRRRRAASRPEAETPPNPMGLFKNLPEEIIQHILGRFIPISSLASLAQTSKSMCHYIRDLSKDSYLLIQPIHRFIHDMKYTEIPSHFIQIGSILRTTSSYLDTAEKIKVLEHFIHELENTFIMIIQEVSLQFAYNCIGLLINHFITDWDDNALRAVFISINKLSQLQERLSKVLLVDKPGVLRKFEKDIRLFVRLVFIEKASSPDQHCLWLSLLMEMFPNHQARLLYLLYGPTERFDEEFSAEVDWVLLSQCTDFGDLLIPLGILKDLADVFLLASNSERFKWSETTKIRFFNEITNTPNRWCLENQAKFLYLLGKNMAVTIMQAKLKHLDIFTDFGGTAYHLALVSSKDALEPIDSPEALSWFVKVVFKSLLILPEPDERRKIITDLFDVWRKNIEGIIENLEDLQEDDYGVLVSQWRSSVSRLALLGHLLTELAVSERSSRADFFEYFN